MILSNCYQSLVISEINAPMGGEKLKNVSKYTICENTTNLLVNPRINLDVVDNEIRQNLKINSKTFKRPGRTETKKQLVKNKRIHIHQEMSKYHFCNCFSLLSEPIQLTNGVQRGFISSHLFYTLPLQLMTTGEHALFEESESEVSQYMEFLHAVLRTYLWIQILILLKELFLKEKLRLKRNLSNAKNQFI